MTSTPGVVSPGTKNRKKILEHNKPFIQSRIQASIDHIVSHFPKSWMLEILKRTAKWRLGRLAPCLLPSG